MRPHILAVLPNYMSARNVINTGVLGGIASHASVTVLLPGAVSALLKSGLDAQNTKVRLLETLRSGDSYVINEGRAPGLRAALRLFGSWLNKSIAYRFNDIQGYSGHRMKRVMSRTRRQREVSAGNFVHPQYGIPFPKSQFILKILKAIFWAGWTEDSRVRQLFSEERPSILFLSQIQAPHVRDFIVVARSLGIPVVGNVGSWDQPTTKGPIPSGLQAYLVQSGWMKSHLIRDHAIPADRIIITGWPQMDHYVGFPDEATLHATRDRLGIVHECRVVLFGLNSTRLGSHEPLVVRRFLERISRDPDSSGIHVVLRPHPSDTAAEERYAFIRDYPNVSLVRDSRSDLQDLRNQLCLSSVIVSTGGTIALDALALGVPCLYIAYDGDLENPTEESVRNLYKLEHLKSLVETGGVPLVHSDEELHSMILGFLADPDLYKSARSAARELHLAPLDGSAAERIVQAILKPSLRAELEEA